MSPVRVPLHKLNANQISEKWVGFLKDCAAFGDDVTHEEMVTTGGTWDAVKDKMVGGTTVPSQQIYVKSALDTPIEFNEGSLKDPTTGTGFVMGHRLGGIVAGESLCARLKCQVPLTQTGVYIISGQRWKMVRLVDCYSVGKRVFWNLVQFVKA